MTTILVVDDTESVRNLFRVILERAGYRVTMAAAGADALAGLVRAEPPDLLLVDIEMPGMSGVEFLRRWTDLVHPARIPVILSSVSDDLPALADALQAYGVAAWLRRPFHRGELLTLVDRLIGPAT
jgi:two-component system chemotaxis response regulator CheY